MLSFYHEKMKFIYSSHRVSFFLLYRQEYFCTNNSVRAENDVIDIRHSSPGCSFVWTLRVVYFPLNAPVYVIKRNTWQRMVQGQMWIKTVSNIVGNVSCSQKQLREKTFLCGLPWRSGRFYTYDELRKINQSLNKYSFQRRVITGLYSSTYVVINKSFWRL